ncbi:MAG: cytochrome b/b6 domain-containing protein [Myxococcota bacterium]
MTPRPTLVWDLPTRVIHWTLAGSLVGALAVAHLAEDDGAIFPLHALLGLVAAFALVARGVWGLVGSRWARFASFPLRPGETIAYLAEALRGAARRYAGHNPGSAWAALAIYGCAAGLAVTGVAMGRGVEAVEEVHEFLGWALIAAVVVHLAGLALHTLRHRELVGLSMVDGRKDVEPAEAIASSHVVPGLAGLALAGAWAATLWAGFEPPELRVLGQTLTIGEEEEEGEDDDD